MNTSPKSLALTMKEAAKLVGARQMIPRAELLRIFGIDVNRRTA